MNQVEEMCNRILLINHGRVLLYGQLAEIKAEHAEHAVVLECDGLPETLEGAQQVKQHNHTYEIVCRHRARPSRSCAR